VTNTSTAVGKVRV